MGVKIVRQRFCRVCGKLILYYVDSTGKKNSIKIDKEVAEAHTKHVEECKG